MNATSARVLAVLLLLATAAASGCGDDNEFQAEALATPGRVTGDYIYTWASGHIEVISINRDKTYRHFLYDNRDALRKGTTNHSWKGTWSAKPGGYHIWNKIIFTPFHAVYDNAHSDHPVVSDFSMDEMTMWWDPFDKKQGAMIRWFIESDYIFVRAVSQPPN